MQQAMAVAWFRALVAGGAGARSTSIRVPQQRSLNLLDASPGHGLQCKPIVDARLKGDRPADKTAGDQSSAEPVETVLGQNRVISPNSLSPVTGEGARQSARIDRRKEGLDRVGDLIRRLILEPLL